MQKRNPAVVFLLSLITFGIYGIVWSVKTKNEMNKLGSNIPTAWLLIIPFVGIYWEWKYSEGVEQVTGGKVSKSTSFLLLFLLSIIGMALLQNEFNNISEVPAGSPQPSNDPLAPSANTGPSALNSPNPAPISPEFQPVAQPPVQSFTPNGESTTPPQDTQGPTQLPPQVPPTGPIVQ